MKCSALGVHHTGIIPVKQIWKCNAIKIIKTCMLCLFCLICLVCQSDILSRSHMYACLTSLVYFTFSLSDLFGMFHLFGLSDMFSLSDLFW